MNWGYFNRYFFWIKLSDCMIQEQRSVWDALQGTQRMQLGSFRRIPFFIFFYFFLGGNTLFTDRITIFQAPSFCPGSGGWESLAWIKKKAMRGRDKTDDLSREYQEKSKKQLLIFPDKINQKPSQNKWTELAIHKMRGGAIVSSL